jgi:hypothetical protein
MAASIGVLVWRCVKESQGAFPAAFCHARRLCGGFAFDRWNILSTDRESGVGDASHNPGIFRVRVAAMKAEAGWLPASFQSITMVAAVCKRKFSRRNSGPLIANKYP